MSPVVPHRGISKESRLLRLGCLALSLLLWAACSEDKDRVIAQKVQERVDEFKKKKMQECREALLQKAESRVDSILLTEARQELQDSLSAGRPSRPVQPPLVPAIDSLAVKPLFEGASGKKGGN